MKVLNVAVTPVCPECMTAMVCDYLPRNKENTDIPIVCRTPLCINNGIEYTLTLPYIEVFKKEQ